MAETIGEPNLNDPTGRMEKILNRALDRHEQLIEKTLPRVVSRPIGSQRTSREAELSDYQQVKDDVQGLAKRLKELMAQEGEDRGRMMFADWVSTMEGELGS